MKPKIFGGKSNLLGTFLHISSSNLRSAVPANALYLQQALQSPSSTTLTPLTTQSADGPEIVQPVYIHPSASVHNTAKIGPNVSISENARIGPGARIKNSIILSGAEVAPHAVVLHSIVAWDCRIGAWARVEGTPLGVQEHHGKVVRGGVKVDAATILGREVVVGEGVVVRNCVVLPNKGINSDVSNEVFATRQKLLICRLLCEIKHSKSLPSYMRYSLPALMIQKLP
jgi:mannose-1-phosphate guanylyltransferase